MEEDITPVGLADESQLNPPAPQGTVGSVEDSNKLSLEEINSLLGKNFPDKESALKAVKDTFSYVGKRKEDIAKELLPNSQEMANELKQIKDNMFYKDNPDVAPYRKVIEKIGGNPDEVIASPEFKDIFEKAKGYDESQKLKTVLVSNSRLASVKDNLSKARDASEKGQNEERDRLATQAVLDSLQG